MTLPNTHSARKPETPALAGGAVACGVPRAQGGSGAVSKRSREADYRACRLLRRFPSAGQGAVSQHAGDPCQPSNARPAALRPRDVTAVSVGRGGAQTALETINGKDSPHAMMRRFGKDCLAPCPARNGASVQARPATSGPSRSQAAHRPGGDMTASLVRAVVIG